jgi:hypothetical protein
VTFLSFRELCLSVLVFIVTATSFTGNSAYGQQSHNLTNLIPSANDPASQHQIFDGGQRLIIIPGLSGNDLAVGVEQPESNEAGRQGQGQGQGQGLIPQQTMIDPIEIRKEQADDKIIRDSEDQRGSIQQEDEEKIGEIQKQQEDKEEKIKENLVTAETRTSKTLQESMEEEQEANHQEDDDRNGKEEKDNFNSNIGIPLELPFP